ncbi:hypothetical protein [Candidatus Chromulinivorax destructor]|nr:hypothetical protein [Candidatus Chromulinivorax destructor]
MIKKLFMVSLLSIASCHLQAVVAIGDNTTAGVTFDFSIGSAIYNGLNYQMWTTTADDLSSKTETVQKYGISYTPFIAPDNSGGTASLISYPYLTSDAMLTTSVDASIDVTQVVNPLLEKAFTDITLVGANPAVVTDDNRNSIYYLQEVTFNDNAKGLNSDEGISTINKFDFADGQVINAIAGVGSMNLVAARSEGAFGSDNPSRLSFIQLISRTYNGASYSCLQEQASEVVSYDTPVLTAGTADLSVIGDTVALYPSGNGLGMYVGLNVVPGSTGTVADNRAVGLFVATGVNATGDTSGSLTYSSVIDSALVQASTVNTPVSAVYSATPGAGQVAVRNISTTSTSTQLGYLFAARDNGVDGAQSIYAMPMVTMPSTNENFGKIAAFNSVKADFTISGFTYRTQGFTQVLADMDEIDIESLNPAVIARLLVGNGPVPIAAGDGYIDQLTVQGDSVYITIQEAFATGTTPGMFKSDALFDVQGRIQAWTTWQRVAGSQDQMLFAIKNRNSGETMFVSGSASNTIQQTTWNKSADFAQLSTKTNSSLPQNQGGAQGVIAFPSTTRGFSTTDVQVSMVALTGNSNVIIAQTGQLDIGTQTFQILPQSASTSIVLNADKGLAIGSVVTTAFGNDGLNNGQNWLFMGGDNGLSVLSHDDGTGFTYLPNTLAAASLIDGNQTCKTLGNFTFVKKIVNDNNFLYVMTNNGVYRIALASAKFTASNPAALDVVQIVTAAQLNSYAYCLDMLIDDEFMLLGTTAGLYSINLQDGLPGVVTPISIPFGLPAVSKIQTLSTTANPAHFYASSNLYVLSIDFATEQARLNRFTITNGVVTPIEDQLLKGQDYPLLIFDYMSNNMFIDGSFGFATSYKIGKQPATVKYLKPSLSAGYSGRHYSLAYSTADIAIAPALNSIGITGIVRDYASGSLLLAADFGLLADS